MRERPHGHAIDCHCRLCDRWANEMASHATQVNFDRMFESRTFDEAMREVQALRTARLESHWRLFRLALCQAAIVEVKNRERT